MKIVFWNIAKNDLSAELSVLAKEINPDILFLAETQKMDVSDILLSLNKNKVDYFFNIDPVCDKIKMFSKFRDKYVKPITSNLRYTVRKIKVPSYEEFNLMCLHFQSKVNWDFVNQSAHSTELNLVISGFEKKTKSTRTVLMGDFNMNPFDFGMVQTTGLHSVMSRDVALKNSRVVDGKDYLFFYNPMWSFYGEQGKGTVHGTIYNTLSQPINYFWNIFDQVLLRPEMLRYFDENSLQIITELDANTQLLKPSKIINDSISDHLPISITIKTK